MQSHRSGDDPLGGHQGGVKYHRSYGEPLDKRQSPRHATRRVEVVSAHAVERDSAPGDKEPAMAKKKAKAGKPKKRTLRVNKKTMRDLGPKESTTGDIRGGRRRGQID
jgi:hypothetical protein